MARGQRKPVEEKIREKEELVKALTIRIESEKRELKELQEIKKKRELEKVSDIILTMGLSAEEVANILRTHATNN